jgi:ribokinase
MNFDVVTFGSAVVDVFVDTDVPEKRGRISYPIGAKILIKDLKFDIGGGGTNTAVAFSRLGFKTGYIGKIGGDLQGKEILSMLKKERVEFLGAVKKEGKSGYSIVLDSRENDRTILTYKGINNTILPDDIKKFRTKWLYFSSLLGESFQTQKKLALKLSKKGVKIAFNPSDYLIKKKNLKEILRVCEILVLNKEEARMLTKKEDTKKVLAALRELGPRLVVVTDKNKEILAYNGQKTYTLKPHKIKVVERTGAGDAFASGFVAGQIADKTIEQSLRLGLRESESVITHWGAKNNLIKMKLK